MLLTTSYLGRRIEIEPFEWGYLAHVLEPDSKTRFVAASASVFKALECAFEAIDGEAAPEAVLSESAPTAPQVHDDEHEARESRGPHHLNSR
jgi:hypothetical protein